MMKGLLNNPIIPDESQASDSIIQTATNDNPCVVVNLSLPADYMDSLPLQSLIPPVKVQAVTICGVSPETFDDYQRRGIVQKLWKTQHEQRVGSNKWV